VVTRPFGFEGKQRSDVAQAGVDALKGEVDALISIPNDRLLQVIGKDTSVKNAFAMCDDILRQAVEGIADLITTPGIINVDFADIRAVMQSAGSALMGIGTATGENRAKEAAAQAISSPLLDVSMQGATGVLFAVAGGDDLTMLEVQEAAQTITEHAAPDAKIIFGTINDNSMRKGVVKVTVIATGFPPNNVKSGSMFSFGSSKKKDDDVSLRVERAEVPTAPANTLSFVPEAQSVRFTQEPERAKPTPAKVEKNSPAGEDTPDDDDWSAIPSFLRRSKIK
jgi:cell division protein FtsZ